MAPIDDPDIDTVHTPEKDPEHEHARLAFAGLWVVLAALVVVILGAYLFLSHRAQTPQITPGQPQKHAAVALLGGDG